MGAKTVEQFSTDMLEKYLDKIEKELVSRGCSTEVSVSKAALRAIAKWALSYQYTDGSFKNDYARPWAIASEALMGIAPVSDNQD